MPRTGEEMRLRAPLAPDGAGLAVAGLQGRMNRSGAVTLKLVSQRARSIHAQFHA